MRLPPEFYIINNFEVIDEIVFSDWFWVEDRGLAV